MKIPLITEIQRFCLQDGPGIRTTIFVKGCPLKCPWCHNPETQNPVQEFYYYADRCTGCGKCAEVCSSKATTLTVGPNRRPLITIDRSKCRHCQKCVAVCASGARGIVGQELSIDEIIQEAVADRQFFANSGGGVTISGGEPLLFPDFTLELAKRLKSEQIDCAVETSCSAPWEKIEPLLDYVDLFIVDIKTLDSEKHETVVGAPLELILRNMETLVECNANIRIHLPIIPGFNNSPQDYLALIQYLGNSLCRISGIDVLPYHSFAEKKYTLLGRGSAYQFRGVTDLPESEIVRLVKGLKLAGAVNVTVGGLVGMAVRQGQRKTG